MQERLQKIMAAAGVDSRRACEKLITQGRVRVDGEIITELGSRFDPTTAQITVDGRSITQTEQHAYVKIYKPPGILSDIGGDSRDRPTVADLLPPGVGRVFPVGRLDLNSEGLMLLTDDGDLAHKLTHPSYQHPKIYYVLVAHRPTYRTLETLRTGVEMRHGISAPAQVNLVDRPPADLILGEGPTKGHWLRITLREGKKRQIRYMTTGVGHPTLRLVRWSIGPLTLAQMQPKSSRHLSKKELTDLKNLARGKPSARKESGFQKSGSQKSGSEGSPVQSDYSDQSKRRPNMKRARNSKPRRPRSR